MTQAYTHIGTPNYMCCGNSETYSRPGHHRGVAVTRTVALETPIMDHLRHPARMLLALATLGITSAQTSAGCSVLQGLGSSCAASVHIYASASDSYCASEALQVADAFDAAGSPTLVAFCPSLGLTAISSMSTATTCQELVAALELFCNDVTACSASCDVETTSCGYSCPPPPSPSPPAFDPFAGAANRGDGLYIMAFLPMAIILLFFILLKCYVVRVRAQRQVLLQHNGFQGAGLPQHNAFQPGAHAGIQLGGGMGMGMPVNTRAPVVVNTGAPMVVNAVPVDAAGLPAGNVYAGQV